MGLTREQAQNAADLDKEELFIPEWLSPQDRNQLAEIEGRLAAMNGEATDDLRNQRDSIRSNATCYVWMLTAEQCEQMQNQTRSSLSNNRQNNLNNFFARLAIATVRNADGVPLFRESDVHWLAKKSFRALNRIANAAMRINGLTQQDQDELLKNSETTTG